jgi:hypothetical protein
MSFPAPLSSSSFSTSSIVGAGENSAFRNLAFEAVCNLTPYFWFHLSSPEALHARQYDETSISERRKYGPDMADNISSDNPTST